MVDGMRGRLSQNRGLDFMDDTVGVVHSRNELLPHLLPNGARGQAIGRARWVISDDAVAASTRPSAHQHAALKFPSAVMIWRIGHPPAANAHHAASKWMRET